MLPVVAQALLHTLFGEMETVLPNTTLAVDFLGLRHPRSSHA